jgi:2,3-dihydro-2,3-dihydroxybenzoate dehydrogenase
MPAAVAAQTGRPEFSVLSSEGISVAERKRFANKIVMVTGAAGGIGSAVVTAFLAEGAVAAAVDRDAARLGELTAKLAADELPACGYRADVTDSAQAEDAVARIEQAQGPIDVLVNAAGVLRPGTATDLTASDWRTTFAVNLDGVFHCCRAVARRMRERRRGVIVTIASNAARVPRVQMAAYGASKAAAASYTKTLGLELAAYGIRCNVISPGSTDTEMLRSLWPDGSWRAASINGSLETFKLGIPLRRIADPEDIAEAVLFVASDEARHITMQDLCVDGGAILGA